MLKLILRRNKLCQIKLLQVKLDFHMRMCRPKSINGSDPKYSVSLIIPKKIRLQLIRLKPLLKLQRRRLSKLGGKIPANLKTPLRDGDIDRPDDPAYADSYFVNANSTIRPV